MKNTPITFNWRIIWYSILIWFLAFVISGFVVLPWFYLVLPVVVFWTTVYFFKKSERSFAAGLKVSIFWFIAIAIMSFAELIGPYYFNFQIYFSDLRNILLFPLILLVPVIYSLFLENSNLKRTTK